MAKHRLVVIGDSLSQGFMSGAIFRTELACPTWVARAMGLTPGEFRVADFSGEGGLPLNVEEVLRALSKRWGETVSWYEIAPLALQVQRIMDRTEDYWERGKGSRGVPAVGPHHNLAVWGFEVQDAYELTHGICRAHIPVSKDNLLSQVPEWPMYRTACRVLNPTFGEEAAGWHQLGCAEALAADSGIENLVVALGANNALPTVALMDIVRSTAADMQRLRHDRKATLYEVEHFEEAYTKLLRHVEKVGAERVFLVNVPHVTIPPVSRGWPPPPEGLSDQVGRRRYFQYYTRPWVWDDDFDPDRHQCLSRREAMDIDECIDGYNRFIADAVEQRAGKGWHLFDACAVLDRMAFRSQQGKVTYDFPKGLIAALKDHEPLRYLVDEDGGKEKVLLDTRFFRAERHDDTYRVVKGGLFSLDGVHPTTIGYGLLAHELMRCMQAAGVAFSKDDVDWYSIVRADTLINDPPPMMAQLQDTLAWLDRGGLLSMVLDEFGPQAM